MAGELMGSNNVSHELGPATSAPYLLTVVPDFLPGRPQVEDSQQGDACRAPHGRCQAVCAYTRAVPPSVADQPPGPATGLLR
jgi:hypothetical protein